MNKRITGGSVREHDSILIVRGADYIEKVADVLRSSARIRILIELQKGEMDLSKLAELINQSKASVSMHVKILSNLGLVKTTYRPGQRGVKKVCWTNIKEIRILLSDFH